MEFDTFFNDIEEDANKLESIAEDENGNKEVLAEENKEHSDSVVAVSSPGIDKEVLVEERREHSVSVAAVPSPGISETDRPPPDKSKESKEMQDKPPPPIILKIVLKGKGNYAIKKTEEDENEKQHDSSLIVKQHYEENGSDIESVKRSGKSRVKRRKNEKIKEAVKSDPLPKKRKRISRKTQNKRQKRNPRKNHVSLTQETVSVTETTEDSKKPKIDESSSNLDPYNFEDEENSYPVPYTEIRKKKNFSEDFRSFMPCQVEKKDDDKRRKRKVKSSPVRKKGSGDLKKAKDLSQKRNKSHLPGIVNKVCLTKSIDKSNKPQTKQMKGKRKDAFEEIVPSPKKVQKLDGKKTGNDTNEFYSKLTNSASDPIKANVPSRKLVHSSVPPQLEKLDSKSKKITNEPYPKLINSSNDFKKANDLPQKLNESLLRDTEKKGKVNESIRENSTPITKRAEGSSKGKVPVSSKAIPHVQTVDGNESGNERNVSYSVVPSCSSEFKRSFDVPAKPLIKSQLPGTVNSVCVDKSTNKSNKLQTEDKKVASKAKVKVSQPILNQNPKQDIEKSLYVTDSIKINNKLQIGRKKGERKKKVSFENLPTISETTFKKLQKVGTGNDTYELYPKLTNSASDLIKASDSQPNLNQNPKQDTEKSPCGTESIKINDKLQIGQKKGERKKKFSFKELPAISEIISKKLQKVGTGIDTYEHYAKLTNSASDPIKANDSQPILNQNPEQDIEKNLYVTESIKINDKLLIGRKKVERKKKVSFKEVPATSETTSKKLQKVSTGNDTYELYPKLTNTASDPIKANDLQPILNQNPKQDNEKSVYGTESIQINDKLEIGQKKGERKKKFSFKELPAISETTSKKLQKVGTDIDTYEFYAKLTNSASYPIKANDSQPILNQNPEQDIEKNLHVTESIKINDKLLIGGKKVERKKKASFKELPAISETTSKKLKKASFKELPAISETTSTKLQKGLQPILNQNPEQDIEKSLYDTESIKINDKLEIGQKKGERKKKVSFKELPAISETTSKKVPKVGTCNSTYELYPKLTNSASDPIKANDSQPILNQNPEQDIEKSLYVTESIKINDKLQIGRKKGERKKKVSFENLPTISGTTSKNSQKVGTGNDTYELYPKLTNSTSDPIKANVPSKKLVHSSVPPQLGKLDNKSRKIVNEPYPKLINNPNDFKKANDSPQKLNESLLRDIEKKGKINESMRKNSQPLTKRTEGSNKGKVPVSSKAIPHVQTVDGKESGNERNVSVVPSCSSEFKRPFDVPRKSLAKGQLPGTVNSACVAKSTNKSNKLQTEDKKVASKAKVKDSQPILYQTPKQDIEKSLYVTESIKINDKLQIGRKKVECKKKVSFKELPAISETTSKKVPKVGTCNGTYELYPKVTNSASVPIKANDSQPILNQNPEQDIDKSLYVTESININDKLQKGRKKGERKKKVSFEELPTICETTSKEVQKVSSKKLPKSILSQPKKVQELDDKEGKDTEDLNLELTNSTVNLKKVNKPKKKSTRYKGTRKRKAKRPPRAKKSAPSNVKKKSDDNNSEKEPKKKRIINWSEIFPRSNIYGRQQLREAQKPEVTVEEVTSTKMRIVPRVPVSCSIPLEPDNSVFGTRLPSLGEIERRLPAPAQAHNTLNTLPGTASPNVRSKAELFIKNILKTIKEQRSMRPELAGTPINMDDLALALKNHLLPISSRPLPESLLTT